MSTDSTTPTTDSTEPITKEDVERIERKIDTTRLSIVGFLALIGGILSIQVLAPFWANLMYCVGVAAVWLAFAKRREGFPRTAWNGLFGRVGFGISG